MTFDQILSPISFVFSIVAIVLVIWDRFEHHCLYLKLTKVRFKTGKRDSFGSEELVDDAPGLVLIFVNTGSLILYPVRAYLEVENIQIEINEHLVQAAKIATENPYEALEPLLPGRSLHLHLSGPKIFGKLPPNTLGKKKIGIKACVLTENEKIRKSRAFNINPASLEYAPKDKE